MCCTRPTTQHRHTQHAQCPRPHQHLMKARGRWVAVTGRAQRAVGFEPGCLCPVAGVAGSVQEVSLAGAGSGVVIVLPAGGQGHGHEDGLHTAAGLQAEDGAAVIDQVVLHVPPAADLLPLLLSGGEGVVLVLGHNGAVRGRHGGGAVAGEGQDLLLALVVEALVEDAAHAAHLAAVLDEEVLVAGGLHLGVVGGVVLVAHRLVRAVEVLQVLGHQVGGGDVGAAAEPPLAGQALNGEGLEVAVVEVHGGAVGVVGVHDGGDASSEEGHLLAGLGVLGHLGVRVGGLQGDHGHLAVHHGHSHAGLLPHVALLHDLGDATAALGALPGVGAELAATVHLLNGSADGVLRIADHLLHLLADGALVHIAVQSRQLGGDVGGLDNVLLARLGLLHGWQSAHGGAPATACCCLEGLALLHLHLHLVVAGLA
mmetsp:Transcript_10171/g.25352  ORF Transcript_10171/g.25352 Transcript_10171/m.25352 type:complete len:426 (+) Transcript_10171:600-1877(+)